MHALYGIVLVKHKQYQSVTIKSKSVFNVLLLAQSLNPFDPLILQYSVCILSNYRMVYRAGQRN